MKRVVLLALGLAAIGCSDELENGTMFVVSGLETDTWTEEPIPVEIELERVRFDGTRETVGTLEVPDEDEAPRFELSGPISRFIVTGTDRDGEAVVRGRSFWLEPDGLRELSVPLFVGRVARFSRPGALLEGVGDNPVLAVIGGRFMLAGGGDADGMSRMTGFDFGFWSPTTTEYYTCGRSSCQAKSMAVVAGSVGLIVGEDWAYVRDFATNYGQQYDGPETLEGWDLVAGGESVQVDDGSAYIVGPTRLEGPTATVVRLTAEGNIQVVELADERMGAAATWVDQRGLLVVGGSDSAPAAELLAASASTPTAVALPPDPTTGAALVAFDPNLVLRLGGRLPDGSWAPSVVLDLSCADDCELLPFEAPIELDRVQAFHIDDSVLAVGEDADGKTAVKLLTLDGLETVELREPRSGARAVRNTLDQVLVVGGTLEDGDRATSIELFTL